MSKLIEKERKLRKSYFLPKSSTFFESLSGLWGNLVKRLLDSRQAKLNDNRATFSINDTCHAIVADGKWPWRFIGYRQSALCLGTVSLALVWKPRKMLTLCKNLNCDLSALRLIGID